MPYSVSNKRDLSFWGTVCCVSHVYYSHRHFTFYFKRSKSFSEESSFSEYLGKIKSLWNGSEKTKNRNTSCLRGQDIWTIFQGYISYSKGKRMLIFLKRKKYKNELNKRTNIQKEQNKRKWTTIATHRNDNKRHYSQSNIYFFIFIWELIFLQPQDWGHYYVITKIFPELKKYSRFH